MCIKYKNFIWLIYEGQQMRDYELWNKTEMDTGLISVTLNSY